MGESGTVAGAITSVPTSSNRDAHDREPDEEREHQPDPRGSGVGFGWLRRDLRRFGRGGFVPLDQDGPGLDAVRREDVTPGREFERVFDGRRLAGVDVRSKGDRRRYGFDRPRPR